MIALVLAGCLGPSADDSPMGVFDHLWSDFDARYALFGARDIDWDAARARWEPEVPVAHDDDALFDALFGLIVETGDDHVYLARYDDGEVVRVVTAGHLGGTTRDDFDPALVEARLDHVGSGGDGRLRWGRLTPDVGWLYVGGFDGDAAGDRPDRWVDDVDVALGALRGVRSLVVDVRNNGGGRGANALHVAAALVDEPARVFSVRTRNGPSHDDFDAPTWWRVVPRPSDRPEHLVLLTNRFTMSAAETFTAAVRTRADVVHVGETTTGALSAMSHERQLPNGWAYTVSVQEFRLPDGTSPEGVGFAPDVEVDNTPEDLAAGRDPMLDRALAEAQARMGAE